MKKLLIANRGEIAARIARTARRMGIATVAVYSDADAEALHVGTADEAMRIGEAAAADSYLNANAILDAARRTGADAIHPGYGFLSESSAFAEACGAAGLVFVGPPAKAIHAMGDKARAKELMAAAGVPVVPGYSGSDRSVERLGFEADRIGYPVLVKASAGGGGRGMRRVDRPGDLAAALESAAREAANAFGDGAVLLEKLIEHGRHIEVQVFADAHGNTIHLGERDCSTQRRHQKVIEEAPSPFVDVAMRAEIGATAVRAAKAVGYVGAGTVEFIVGADRRYYFLEMNTRLQVEHPVTEMVTGIDLVEWQLRVAAGALLPLGQDDVQLDGHAIEVRLYAEDPYAGFMPQTGQVLHWRPASDAGDGVRVDNGIAEGGRVTPCYDPMIAKIIAHGPTRAEAIDRLRNALLDRPLFGVVTNRRFLVDLLDTDAFRRGGMTTDLLDLWADQGAAIVSGTPAGNLAFAVAGAILGKADKGDWFRSTGIAEYPLTLVCADVSRKIVLRFERGALSDVTVDGASADLSSVSFELPEVSFVASGVRRRTIAVPDGRDLWLDLDGCTFRFSEPDPLAARPASDDPSRLAAPVSGLVRHVSVAPGTRVEPGDPLLVIEAMKMETTLVAKAGGVVLSVRSAAGQQARAGDVLIEIEVES